MRVRAATLRLARAAVVEARALQRVDQIPRGRLAAYLQRAQRAQRELEAWGARGAEAQRLTGVIAVTWEIGA